MYKFERLFSPIKIGSLELRNRIVMLAMGSHTSEMDGNPSDRMIAYYAARAKGGVALVTTEFTMVHPTTATPYHAALYKDEYIPQWKKLADAVHSHKGKVFPQLCHVGRQTTSQAIGTQPVAASPIPCPVSKEIPRELTVAEIEEIVSSFGDAAYRAREAGCDGVEIHGAHGYLVCNFMSPWSNKRTDDYGGSVVNRARFAMEVVRNIKEKCGNDFPVSFRFSSEELVPGGLVPEETRVIAGMLAEAGVDILNVSRGSWGAFRWFLPPYGSPLAINAEAASKVRQTVNVPVLAGHRINNPFIAEQVLKEGKADLIGMGRALIADPELPNKAAEGRLEDIVPCIACIQRCAGQKPAGKYWIGCTLNPATGQEREMKIAPAERKKKVLVAGAGLAGMEAARVAALRGHDVTLMEKSDKTGGQFNLACVPPMKQEFAKAITYLTHQIKKAGVKVEFGKEVTPEVMDQIKPDAVVVATGAVPLIPTSISGIDNPVVTIAHDLLAGKAVVDKKVVIIGGGSVGCETAEYIAERGCRDITVLEMLDDIAKDMVPESNREFLKERLEGFGIKTIASAKVTRVLDDSVAYEKGKFETVIEKVTNVILAVGARSVDDLSEKLQGKGIEVYVIGDAQKPRGAMEAMEEGAVVGHKI